jgi:uncharacterized protein YlxP (DUF503 family)
LRLENSHSLKEKRHVVQSLKERLRNRFNVAVAEIDHQDLWQRAAVAAVTVSSDQVHAEKVLRSVEDEAACWARNWWGYPWNGCEAGDARPGAGSRSRRKARVLHPHPTPASGPSFLWTSTAH